MRDLLVLTLFGSPEVRLHGQLVTGFRSNKAQALLCYLAVTGRPHTRSMLAGLLWGDQPEAAARTSLSKCLSNLRDLVGDAVLIDRQTVAFSRDYPYQLDTERFMAGVGQPPTPETIYSLQAALALYRGDFLEGFYVRDAPDFEQWLLVQRAHYREAVVQGLHTLANYADQQGDLSQAIAHTRRLLALEPWREEAHRQLMTRLARSGQRTAALAQYESCRRILAEELAVEPDAETMALVEAIRAGDFDTVTRSGAQHGRRDKVNGAHDHPIIVSPPHSVMNSLPIPPTPLIGRERELTELGELLVHRTHRLITVTGPGGMGKTRLALAAAATWANIFREGVAFVPLVAITNPAFLEHAILQALAQPLHGEQNPQTQLLGYLRNKEMLLVLDNYEQLLPDVSLLLALLGQVPGVMLLVTSRERLALQAEQLFPLAGLAYPRPTLKGAPEEFAACQLFLQRVDQIQHHFAPNDEARAAIIHICRVTEGLPLAIELAAGSLRIQSVVALAAAFEASQSWPVTHLRDLPARHHSMPAVFAHSWQLLTIQEQRVLARLSVFGAGFGLAAAENVGEADSEILAALLDKSLVRQQERDRFDLHELLRQFAAERLSECGQKDETHWRHLCYFLALAEEAALHLRSPDQADWLEQVAIEYGNLRMALAWSVTRQQHASGARLGIALWRFWYIRGYYEEGWNWLERLLPLADSPEQRANLLYGQGMLARRRGESAVAADCFAQSLALFRQQQDSRGIASALRGLGFIHYYHRDYKTARSLLEEALVLFRALDDLEGIAVTLQNLSYFASDPEESEQLEQESLALRRRTGNLHGIATSLASLIYGAIGQADYATARVYLQEHLQINEALGNQNGIASSLCILASVAFAERDYIEAQSLYENSLKVCQETGDRMLLPVPTLGLGAVALKRNEFTSARSYIEQALNLYQALNVFSALPLSLGYLAALEMRQGQARRALALISASVALGASMYTEHFPFEQAEFDHVQASARQLLSDEAATQAWTAGQTLTPLQAIAYALGQTVL